MILLQDPDLITSAKTFYQMSLFQILGGGGHHLTYDNVP